MSKKNPFAAAAMIDLELRFKRLLDQAHAQAHNVAITSVGWEMIAMDLNEATEAAEEIFTRLKGAGL